MPEGLLDKSEDLWSRGDTKKNGQKLIPGRTNGLRKRPGDLGLVCSMIISTLIVCCLLAFLPLVISTFSFLYMANVFSKAIFALSAVNFLLGLAQFALILGLSYQLFSPSQMEQASRALQYVSIAGGAIMIVAGCLWVGYFRRLIKSKPVETAPHPHRAL